jgi:hypothetical protein
MTSTSPALAAPEASEHAPYYAKYVGLVPRGDIRRVLEAQLASVSSLLAEIPEERASYRYAPEKWTIRDVVGHLVDTERVFGFRALWVARGDRQALPGFEQDEWEPFAAPGLATAALADVVAEWVAVRTGHLHLLRRLTDADWLRSGEASGKQVSVRALAHIMAGHVEHHVKILNERYLTPAS